MNDKYDPTRKVAEFLGLSPEELRASGEKLKEQTRGFAATLREELRKHGDALGARLDGQLKEHVEKAEKLAEKFEATRGELEQTLEAASKEAARLADQAGDEIKKALDLARAKLGEALASRRSEDR